MFCSNCGAKVIDGAAFCQKCGAKVGIDSAEKTEIRKTEAKSVSVPKGKAEKRKKLYVILGVVAVLVVLILIIAAIVESGNSESVSTSADTTGVNLSQSYVNEEEGFSFQYPKAWIPVSEEELSGYSESEESIPLLVLANEIEDLPEESTYIMVFKFGVTQDYIDRLFASDEEFIANFGNDVSVVDTSVTEIDGVPAREITYLESDGFGCQSYFYAVGLNFYRIDFIWKGETPGNNQRFFDAIMESYTIDVSVAENQTNTESEWASVYAAEVQNMEATATTETSYDLIYINEDDMPELVVDEIGYNITVYTCVDGELVFVLGGSYGAGSSTSFSYLPKQNVIHSVTISEAGAVFYENYMKINGAWLESMYDADFSICYYKDINGDGWIDENEYSDEPYYYYGVAEITEEDYESFRIPGEYEFISGEETAETILSQLGQG